VSRSLAACQGALLLVDAAQGIQAQVGRRPGPKAGSAMGAPRRPSNPAGQPSTPPRRARPAPPPYPAQTVANFYLAFEQDLALLPVLNKVDLPAADPDAVAGQLAAVFDLDPASALRVSARTGVGLEALLPAIVE
jgi:translation elongation factor EF-4